MIGFLAPQKVDFEILAETESKDYTVLLHFSPVLRDRIIAASGHVNSAMVTSLNKKSLKKGINDYDAEDAHRSGFIKNPAKSGFSTNHLSEFGDGNTAGGINYDA